MYLYLNRNAGKKAKQRMILTHRKLYFRVILLSSFTGLQINLTGHAIFLSGDYRMESRRDFQSMGLETCVKITAFDDILAKKLILQMQCES
ncbi:CLUMA_CG011347, isoform A [Clunio marinus]|uniref:CLUMA_CG011347, isoform A n=1 Tax=Clunio marinus TaxID=568069 RepID=A0A1J1ICG1_9DIPT|nr:CLUMA_CG011347, isoform A [Clunio marinus]